MSANDNTTAGLPGGLSLEDLESVIARGLPNYDAMAVALLEIHDRKLYRKPRAYQMLHFARLKKL